jgi:hypothetical protein
MTNNRHHPDIIQTLFGQQKTSKGQQKNENTIKMTADIMQTSFTHHADIIQTLFGQQKQHQNAEGKGPGEKVMRIFEPLAERTKSACPHQRLKQALAIDIVQAAEPQNDEGGGDHPMGKALDRFIANDLAACGTCNHA